MSALFAKWEKPSISISLRFAKTWGEIVPPKYRHFSDAEAAGIEPDLMAMLDVARERAGVPFWITCGLRTLEENSAVGGVPNSAHLADGHGLSRAVDLACENSLVRWKMVFALKEAGIRRIVIEPRCLHVDIDETKPRDVLAIWEKAA